jgi:hypothetical protein
MTDVNAGIEAGANTNTPVQINDVEAKARRLGWLPKEEFRGDPTRWKPADEYVEYGESILPIVRQNNEVLHDRLARQERDLADAKQVLYEMREMSRRAEQRVRDQVLAEVEAEKRAAVETADTQRYDAAQARMRQMDAPAVAGYLQAPAHPPYIDPVITQWVGENSWFNLDPGMAAYATAMFQQRQNCKHAPAWSVAGY